MLNPPLVLIDLDHSYDRATGTITDPQARAIMEAVDSYWEASPTDGLHGLVKASKPVRNIHTDTLEIYGHDRFTTITTDHITGTPTTINYRQDALDSL